MQKSILAYIKGNKRYQNIAMKEGNSLYKRYLSYVASFLFGFVFTYLFHAGNSGKKKLVLQWEDYCYHIHHWITFLIVMAVLHYVCDISSHTKLLMYYFLFGVVCEDLMFKNLLKIKSKCQIKILE
jgi:hypothetical protein